MEPVKPHLTNKWRQGFVEMETASSNHGRSQNLFIHFCSTAGCAIFLGCKCSFRQDLWGSFLFGGSDGTSLGQFCVWISRCQNFGQNWLKTSTYWTKWCTIIVYKRLLYTFVPLKTSLKIFTGTGTWFSLWPIHKELPRLTCRTKISNSQCSYERET